GGGMGVSAPGPRSFDQPRGRSTEPRESGPPLRRRADATGPGTETPIPHCADASWTNLRLATLVAEDTIMADRQLATRRSRNAMSVRPMPMNGGGPVSWAVHEVVTAGGILSVGVLNLVRDTLVTAVAGARDVAGEVGVTATTAARGSIRAAAEIGGDLGGL